jgi:hypothetical protein
MSTHHQVDLLGCTCLQVYLMVSGWPSDHDTGYEIIMDILQALKSFYLNEGTINTLPLT